MSSPVPQSTESEQGYCTPDWLFAQLDAMFGYVVDLAASEENAHCDTYIDEATDSLRSDFSWAAVLDELGGWGFCNPPFKVIEPWVRKAITEGAKLSPSLGITLLVPHNVSASWFVEGARYAETLIISPRFKYRHPDPEAAKAAAAAKGKRWSDSAPQGSMLMCFTRESVESPTEPGQPLRIGHLTLVKPGSRQHALPSFAPVLTKQEQGR